MRRVDTEEVTGSISVSPTSLRRTHPVPMIGIFAGKGERGLYDAAHPLNLLWNALLR